jgi:hypothetical protein
MPGRLPDVRVDSSKPLIEKVDQLGGKVAFRAWNALSRIDVVEHPEMPPMILIDAAAQTDIWPPREDTPGLRSDISTLPYQMRSGASVIIIGSGGGKDVQGALALGARAVTADEMQFVRAYAKRFDMQVHHDPVSPEGGTFYDVFLAAPDPRQVEGRSPVAIHPVSDDSPFFFQMSRWRNLSLKSLQTFTGRSFLEPLALPVGQIALLTALGLGILLSIVLLAIPLAARSLPRAGRYRWLGYFFGLGLAYIIVEVVLMQRFTLFLGHPTYSVTTVLFAILLFSGLGSAWSGTRRGTAAAMPLLFALPAALLVLTFAVPPITRELIGLPLSARLPLAIGFIAPIAFLMGMPFPIGIRTASAESAAHIPWAWAANGCASVIGSVCAVLGAMVWSFSAMLVAASTIYALVLLGLARMRAEVL